MRKLRGGRSRSSDNGDHGSKGAYGSIIEIRGYIQAAFTEAFLKEKVRAGQTRLARPTSKVKETLHLQFDLGFVATEDLMC
jgi:hypothetical protein